MDLKSFCGAFIPRLLPVRQVAEMVVPGTELQCDCRNGAKPIEPAGGSLRTAGTKK